MVSRPRLVARLVRGRQRRLALLRAPAGWGKTTQLGEWIASPEEPRPFAWVSLDPAHGDPIRFWSYVIAALGLRWRA
jgi:LuxR family transcriptional regulator, maltose regulon positive regulatory protein